MWDGFIETTWEVVETLWAANGFGLAAGTGLAIGLALIGALFRIAYSALRAGRDRS